MPDQKSQSVPVSGHKDKIEGSAIVKRTFYIALSRLLGERDLVGQGSGRMGLILPSDCSPTPLCPSHPSRPPRLAPLAQLRHLKKYARRPQ